MNERMGFHGVAKNPTKVFHSMPVQEFSVNMAAWKALPDDIKAIVQSTHPGMDVGSGAARGGR